MARNSSRFHLERCLQALAASLPAGTRILDAGSGRCPYRALFQHCVYHTADFCQVAKEYGAIDFVCDLTSIPVEAGSYDVVISTQVLEHVPDPAAVLREFARTLRPGGRLFLSAPLSYEEHEQPFDYFRYTQFGLRHLLTNAGFEVVRLDWLEGYYGALSHQLKRASRWLPRSPRAYGGGVLGFFGSAFSFLLRPFFSFAGRVLGKLDRRHRYTAKGYCINYIVECERRPSEGWLAA